jgi:hypothetical protein
MLRESLFDDEKRWGRALDALDDLVEEAHLNAKEHGFYDAYEGLRRALKDTASERPVSSMLEAARRDFILAQLVKIASEVGEAVSAIQHDNGFMEELADIIIRTLDLGGFVSGVPGELPGMVLYKMGKNLSRPYLHGKTC